MESVDISNIIDDPQYSPQDAADNLDGGQLNNVDPDEYGQNKKIYNNRRKADIETPTATLTVGRWIAQSQSHRDAIQEDIPILSKVEKYVNFFNASSDSVSRRREIERLARLKMDQKGYLSSEDSEDLSLRRLKEDDFTNNKEFDYNMLQAFPVTAYGVGKNMVLGLIEHSAPIISGAGIGAVAGAIKGPKGLITTPISALAGALGGAATGASLLSMPIDTYQQTAGDIYNTLDSTTKEDGTPLDITEENKTSIAKGAGVLVAAVDKVGDAFLVGRFLNGGGKIFTKKLLTNILFPTISSVAEKEGTNLFLKYATEVGKSALLEGTTETVQEVIQIFAEEIGKSWDNETLDSVETGMKNAFSSKSYQRLLDTFAVSAGIGGTTHVAGSGLRFALGTGKEVPAPPSGAEGQHTDVPPPPPGEGTTIDLKAGEEPKLSTLELIEANRRMTQQLKDQNIPDPVKGTRALNEFVALAQISETTKNTTLYKNNPNALYEIRKDMVKALGSRWVEPSDLEAYAKGDPDELTRVMSLFSPDQRENGKKGAPMSIPAEKILQEMGKNLYFGEIVRSTPDAPSAKETFTLNQQLLAKAGSKVTEFSTIQDIIEGNVSGEKVSSAEEFATQPTYTDAIQKIIPESEARSFNEKDKKIKLEMIEAQREASEKEMNQVIDVTTEILSEIKLEEYYNNLPANSNIRIVENFINGINLPTMIEPRIEELKKNLEKGIPVFAINPATVSLKLSNYFFYKTLRDRKVFSNNGLDIKDVMGKLGVTSEQELLNILANTPTNKEAHQKKINFDRSRLRSEVAEKVDLNHTQIVKGYENVTALHQEQLRDMLTKNWSKVAGVIKRVTLPIPKIAELRFKATGLTAGTKIGDLNYKQFDKGEKNSNANSIKAILKYFVEQAFKFKENAMLNSELARATHIAIGNANNNIRFITKLFGEAQQKVLKNAGPKFLNAANELLNSLDLDKPKKITGENNLGKLQKEFLENGKGDIGIPENLFANIDPKNNIYDLTVEQLQYYTDTLRAIYKAAQIEDNLITDFQNERSNLSVKTTAQIIHDIAVEHPEYDETKDLSNKPTGANVATLLKAEDLLVNIASITRRLDVGAFGDFFTKLIYHPLKGIGVHAGRGESFTKSLGLQIHEKYKTEMKTHPELEYAGITKIDDIPEFQNSPKLKKDIYKSDLIVMASHWGTMQNRERLTNFGVSLEDIEKVLMRELSTKDWDFIQSFVWDTYESFKPHVKAMAEYTNARKIDFTEDVSFEANGKTYRGGHMNLSYDEQLSGKEIAHKLSNEIAASDGGVDTDYVSKYASDGMTKRHYTVDRSENVKKTINLDMRTIQSGFDEVIYDLAMRIPVRDVLLLLKNSSIGTDISRIVGPSQFQLLINNVKEATHSVHAATLQLYSAERNLMKKMLASIDQRFVISVLAGNMSTFAVQFFSIGPALRAMGSISGAKHITLAVTKMFSPFNSSTRSDFWKLATKLSPEIGNYLEHTSEVSISNLQDLLPKKRMFDAKLYNNIKGLQEKTNEILVGTILGWPDAIQKLGVALGAYSQFHAGEAPGWSKERLVEMTEEERESSAQAYVHHISAINLTTTSALDKAAIQKHDISNQFVKFWNDSRNQLNANVQEYRNIKYDIQKFVEYTKAREHSKAADKFFDAGGKILLNVFMIAITGAFLRGLRGEEGPLEDQSLLNPNLKRLEKNTEKYLLDYFPMGFMEDAFAQHIPLVRDIRGIVKSQERGIGKINAVTFPLGSVLGHAGIAIYGVSEMISNINLASVKLSMADREMKSTIITIGHVVGGLPTQSTLKLLENYSEIKKDVTSTVTGLLGLKQVADDFIKEFGETHPDDPIVKEVKQLQQDLETSAVSSIRKPEPEQVDFYEEELKSVVGPKRTTKELKHYLDVLQNIEGGNIWNQMNEAGSSAYGFYQITKGTWENVQNKYPGLQIGPYDNPNREESIIDQKKIVLQLIRDNIKNLKDNNIPLTNENLYAFHMLGEKVAEKVLIAKGNELLSKYIPNKETLESNGFNKRTLVKDYKRFLNDRLQKKMNGNYKR